MDTDHERRWRNILGQCRPILGKVMDWVWPRPTMYSRDAGDSARPKVHVANQSWTWTEWSWPLELVIIPHSLNDRSHHDMDSPRSIRVTSKQPPVSERPWNWKFSEYYSHNWTRISMSILKGLRDYFWKSDVILCWPHTFGVIMAKIWSFGPGVKNYDFAPRDARVAFRDQIKLFFEADAIFGCPRIPRVVMDKNWNFDKNWKIILFYSRNFAASFRGLRKWISWIRCHIMLATHIWNAYVRKLEFRPGPENYHFTPRLILGFRILGYFGD